MDVVEIFKFVKEGRLTKKRNINSKDYFSWLFQVFWEKK